MEFQGSEKIAPKRDEAEECGNGGLLAVIKIVTKNLFFQNKVHFKVHGAPDMR